MISQPDSLPPTRLGRRPKAQQTEATRETILDAGEILFSRQGFHGVTIREIAKAAGVDTALAHYYFGTKQGLFDAVFLRRAEIVNRERFDSIDRYESEAGVGSTIEGFIEAFLRPVLDRTGKDTPGWAAYFALVGQVNSTPAWGGATMTKAFDPLIHHLLDRMRPLLPAMSEANLYWAYHMLSGSLTLTLANTGRIDRLSGGLCKSSDFDAILERMVPYAAAGFRALAVA